MVSLGKRGNEMNNDHQSEKENFIQKKIWIVTPEDKIFSLIVLKKTSWRNS